MYWNILGAWWDAVFTHAQKHINSPNAQVHHLCLQIQLNSFFYTNALRAQASARKQIDSRLNGFQGRRESEPAPQDDSVAPQGEVFIYLRGEKMFILKTREMFYLSVRMSTHENRFRTKIICWMVFGILHPSDWLSCSSPESQLLTFYLQWNITYF